MTKDEFYTMRQVKLSEVDKSKLADIHDVKINPDDPIEFRMENFLKQVKNPYCFRCGDIAVKLCFSANGKSLYEKLAEHFIRKKAE